MVLKAAGAACPVGETSGFGRDREAPPPGSPRCSSEPRGARSAATLARIY